MYKCSQSAGFWLLADFEMLRELVASPFEQVQALRLGNSMADQKNGTAQLMTFECRDTQSGM